MTSSNGKIKFGAAEWIAIVALALTPACGFATWGMSMHARIAVVESTQTQMATVLTKLETKTDILAKLEIQQAAMIDRQVAMEGRMDRLERDIQRLTTNGSE